MNEKHKSTHSLLSFGHTVSGTEVGNIFVPLPFFCLSVPCDRDIIHYLLLASHRKSMKNCFVML